MFLTDVELIELTGWRRVFDQRRWLKAHGWKFEISGIGRPVVMRRHAEQKMLDAADAKPAPPPVQHSSIPADDYRRVRGFPLLQVNNLRFHHSPRCL